LLFIFSPGFVPYLGLLTLTFGTYAVYLFIYHLHSMDLLGIDPLDIGIVKYEQRIH